MIAKKIINEILQIIDICLKNMVLVNNKNMKRILKYTGFLFYLKCPAKSFANADCNLKIFKKDSHYDYTFTDFDNATMSCHITCNDFCNSYDYDLLYKMYTKKKEDYHY